MLRSTTSALRPHARSTALPHHRRRVRPPARPSARSPARRQARGPRAAAHSSARSHARLRVRRRAFGAANAFESTRLRATIGLKFYAPGWGAGERRLLSDPYLLLSNIMPKVGSSQKSLFACAWPRRGVLTPVRTSQNACGACQDPPCRPARGVLTQVRSESELLRGRGASAARLRSTVGIAHAGQRWAF